MKKTTIGFLSLILAANCLAENCSFSEASFLGDWKAVSRGAPFEVMSFEMDREGKHFNSWMHERPDFLDGKWTYENCILRVMHATEENLSYEFIVKSATKHSIVFKERNLATEVRYKRIAGANR